MSGLTLYCNESSSRRSSSDELSKAATPRDQFLSSLPLVDIATLPKDETECSICTHKFCDYDGCRDKAHEEPVFLPCGHIFGSKCAATWFAEKDSCPMCRAQMFKMVMSYWF